MTSDPASEEPAAAHSNTRPAPDPAAYNLAYEEAKRALEEQERAVSELRSRAGQLIAAAAITTSFFGGRAIGSHVHLASWVAIGCFIGLSLSVLAILWHRRDWEFALSPAQLITTYIEPTDDPPVDLPTIHRDLALHMGRQRSKQPTPAALGVRSISPRRDPPRLGHRIDPPGVESSHGQQAQHPRSAAAADPA